MKSSFYVKNEKMKIFQDLVKAFNFRFEFNPIIGKERTYVSIDGDHLPMEKCNEFFVTWERLNMKIKEVPQKTKFQKLLKKFKFLTKF